jgi:hypothetical protein
MEEQKDYFVDEKMAFEREESMAYFKEDLGASKKRSESFA